MYHINHEGKVYPCRAKIRSCPYGKEWHAATREELYYKSMRFSPQVKILEEVKNEIAATGRLRSLYSLSNYIENVTYPIETIVANLEYAIKLVEDENPKVLRDIWVNFVDLAGEYYSQVLRHGLDIVKFDVPPEIQLKGREIFNERYGGRVIYFSGETENSPSNMALRKFHSLEKEIAEFEEYRKFGLTEANKEGTLGWLKRDFYQFSHDLNTSKMLTRPIFYENIEEAKEKIKQMSDYELLGAYDDYLISDKEIMENVELANNFEFRPRRDLSREANINIRKWYDRNKAIVNDWVDNTPKRVLLSMEMAKELDRRGIYRQETALGQEE